MAESQTTIRRVGILTAGGLAPCLSACVGYLIQFYADEAERRQEAIEVVLYFNGFQGLLTDDFVVINADSESR